MFTRSIYCTLFLLVCFDFDYECICISVYSVTLSIFVINLWLYVGLLQFCGVFLYLSCFLASSLFFLSCLFFIILTFKFLNLLYFFYIYSFICLSYCSFALAVNLYINLHPLHLFNFAYLFFLSFPLNIFVSFVFIALFPTWHLALILFCSLYFS